MLLLIIQSNRDIFFISVAIEFLTFYLVLCCMLIMLISPSFWLAEVGAYQLTQRAGVLIAHV